MSKLPTYLVRGCFCLVLASVLFVGWWLAGERQTKATSVESAALREKGPVDPAYCGPGAAPMPPPSIDSPFGLHLYAQRAKGVVFALPAIGIVDQLVAPPGVSPAAAAQPDAAPKNDTPLDDVQSVGVILQEFRRAFGAMPVGELNDEIVRRLQGENPQGIAVLPKSHPSINGDGELVDRWGTAYRFHPESAWHMTVRSAGPDKKMWTNDDLLEDGGQDSSLTGALTGAF